MAQARELGSAAWLEQVFNTPPARDIQGRSRPTIRHAPRYDGQTVWTEGGNEALATYLLEYFKLLGVVRRWKSQPFHWMPPGALDPRVPDFCVELTGGPAIVVQVKGAKYLTPQVQDDFERERGYAKSFGLLHLVWTDKHPLTPAVASLFFCIRRARNTAHNSDELNSLVGFVTERAAVTAMEISLKGYDLSLLEVGIRQGKLFVKLTEKLHENSIVSSTPLSDARSFLLGSGFDSQGWWNSLPD